MEQTDPESSVVVSMACVIVRVNMGVTVFVVAVPVGVNLNS